MTVKRVVSGRPLASHALNHTTWQQGATLLGIEAAPIPTFRVITGFAQGLAALGHGHFVNGATAPAMFSNPARGKVEPQAFAALFRVTLVAVIGDAGILDQVSQGARLFHG